jgi:hypothetical protein
MEHVPPDAERLDQARERRAYVRMQLKVTRRLRERRLAAGEQAADVDRRLDELTTEMAGLDVTVEGLRAKLGRAHRQIDGG